MLGFEFVKETEIGVLKIVLSILGDLGEINHSVPIEIFFYQYSEAITNCIKIPISQQVTPWSNRISRWAISLLDRQGSIA